MYLLRANIFHTAHLNIVTATNQTTDAHNIYSLAYCESLLSARVSGVPRGVFWGVQTPPPRNSEDIVGVLDRMSKKNQRLDFLL